MPTVTVPVLSRRARSSARSSPASSAAATTRSGSTDAIDVEVWEVPTAAFGSFVDGIPAPLGIGTLQL
ncbi:MAG: hypothetical protein E6H74_13650, partial [Betaproteobacteria bacterium]